MVNATAQEEGMKIELTNFRCYRGTHSFVIDDSGITLISGASGAGKTSLVMAIFFAITGVAPPKVISDGADSCRVSLFWDSETVITRTKRPNRVVIDIKGQTFEDDLAQTYITRIFGRHFDSTSYIQQQYQKTFVYLSPSEKLDILEKLCFEEDGDNQPEAMKKQTSILLRELSNKHIEVKSRFQTLEQRYPMPIDLPDPILPPSSTSIEEIMSKLDLLKKQLKTAEHTEFLLQRQHALRTELTTLPTIAWSESALTEHIYALKQLEQIHIESELWKTHSKEDCDLMIQDYLRDIAYLKEHAQLSDSVESLAKFKVQLEHAEKETERIRLLHEGEYSCPECQTLLALVNDELVRLRRSARLGEFVTTQEKKKRLKELEQHVQSLRAKVQSLPHFQSRLQELHELVNPEENISDLESDLKWLREYQSTESHKESTNQAFTKQQQALSKSILDETLDKHSAQELLTQVRKRSQLLSELQACETELQGRPILDLSQLQRAIVEAEEERSRYDQYKLQLEWYQHKVQEYEQFVAHSRELERLKGTLTDLECRLNALSDLKQLILKTESEIIESRIAEIANLVNAYAEHVFMEPITVELKTLKRTSTTNDKVQIQLEVFYKNMQCDISLLSGGEQARLNLAFILAFAHVFHSPLLLLDECTSNLDQDLTETVLEQIQTTGIAKVILIAHQVVEGNFTQILTLQ